jgi:nucleotide-binding universal stress UspA family protein
MNSVLVPVDGSECSLRAVRYLVDGWQEGRRPTLHLLNVQSALTGDVSQFVSRTDIKDYHKEMSAEALRPARALLDAAGIGYQEHAEVGHVPDLIVQCAERLRCDHIVMGTHGRSALADALAGSMTVKVLHLTRLPVVLVK